MNRTHGLLAAALVVQLALILIVRGPWAGPDRAAGGGLLLPELESITAQKVEIEDGEGSQLTLARRDGDWEIETLDGYPADSTRVTKMIDDLKNARTGRPVVSSGRYHKALKVSADAFERRVRLFDQPSGDAKVEFLIGTSPSYRVSHARREGDDRVFEATGLSPWDLSARSDAWVDRKLVDLPSDDVTTIEVENDHGRFALEKRDGVWKITHPSSRAGRTADNDKVMAFVRPLASLYILNPVGRRDPAQGLEAPAATVTLKTGAPDASPAPGEAGSRVVTLQIGAEKQAGDGERYASRDGFDFAVTLSKATADKALEQKVADLLP